ncbi:MAG: SpoIIE family protein phosphatase [Ignavibacteria bacterium]|jgi:sigma-B regulation protein RsbU (phosphoserine phosphatase)|nr:SpoIIE family protein phosphatase [Ignavibacteria bacterium]
MAEKLLVVDDEPDLEIVVTQRFRKAIRAKQYLFFFAHNGLEALEIISEQPDISVVITDINMPEMTGLELLQKIKELNNPKLKVIIVSAYGDMPNIRFAMNNGSFDFLTKPIDMNDLEKTIEKTIELVKVIRDGIESHERLIDYERELDAARQIQQAILPKEFPPFSNPNLFDIYGRMKAAKMVGGDLFDFFAIDDENLGFVIGDVSGKGIPSSIFMAVARTLIHSYGQTGVSTAECLRLTNGILCIESVDSMFVTVFYGILKVNTGEVRFTNAGHNYPYLLENNGGIRQLDNESNIILGVFDEAQYTEHSFFLKPNESIVLYTDGVNEAMDTHHNQLGYDTFQKHLATMPDRQSPKSITDSIFDLVKAHEADTEQSDDITVLTITYFGNK